jgi:hypothetical protein
MSHTFQPQPPFLTNQQMPFNGLQPMSTPSPYQAPTHSQPTRSRPLSTRLHVNLPPATAKPLQWHNVPPAVSYRRDSLTGDLKVRSTHTSLYTHTRLHTYLAPPLL